MTRSLKPDAQGFDEIRITTVPRFKTSGLSGDEWRISAKIELMRKGKVVFERNCGDVRAAAMLLPGVILEAGDNGLAYYAVEDDICDQEGCSEKGTVKLKVLKWFCDRPGQHQGVAYEENNPHYRLFCSRHSHRGDAAFDDSDSNYEVVDGDVRTPEAQDVKPAVFGGVLNLSDLS